MFDLLVMHYLSQVKLSDVKYFSGTSATPSYLRLTARDMTGVTKVLVNGIESNGVTILSKHELAVTIPPAAQGDAFRTLGVFKSIPDPSNEGSGITEWKIGSRPRLATGWIKMAQTFMLHLLKSPGSDLFNPTHGGGILAMVGENIVNSQGLLSDVTKAVLTTQTQFKELQARRPNIDPNEKLMLAALEGVSLGDGKTMAGISLRLRASSGLSFVSGVSDLTSMLQSGSGFI